MKKQIIDFLTELRPEYDFTQQVDFIESGMLDSLDIVALIDFISETFGVNIPGNKIKSVSFRSIDAIVSLIDENK